MTALELIRYSAGYGTDPVFSPVSKCFTASDLVHVRGGNGVGKSTLLKAIVGLCPIEHGHVIVDGTTLDGRSPTTRIRQGVKYVRQQGGAFLSLTVRENLMLAMEINKTQDKQGFDNALTNLGELRSRLDDVVGSMSGGEQRIVAISRALIGNVKVLLLDEVLAGLSKMARTNVLNNVRECAQRENCAVLWAEHDSTILPTHCSEVIYVNPAE